MAGYLPEFIPAESPTAGLRLINEAVATTSSAMDRTQRRNIEYRRLAMEREEASRRQQQYEMQRPFNEAQVRNGIAQADFDYQVGLDNSEQYQRANSEMAEFNREWIGAMDDNDENSRLMKFSGILSRAGKYSGIKGPNDLIKVWQGIYATQARQMLANRQIARAIEKQGLVNEGRTAVADMRSKNKKQSALDILLGEDGIDADTSKSVISVEDREEAERSRIDGAARMDAVRQFDTDNRQDIETIIGGINW